VWFAATATMATACLAFFFKHMEAAAKVVPVACYKVVSAGLWYTLVKEHQPLLQESLLQKLLYIFAKGYKPNFVYQPKFNTLLPKSLCC
jgi:hypothetical protein